MSPNPFEDQVAQGYEPPSNTQFNVFLENRVGKLHELVSIFEGHDSRVVAIDILNTTDYAVARILTTNAHVTRRLLTEKKLPFAESPIVVVQVEKNKTLAGICTTLLAAEVSIHYAYGLLVHPNNHPALAIYTDDQTLATQLLFKKGFTLLAENDMDNPISDDPFDS